MKTNISIVAMLALLVAACAPAINVSSDFDKDIDFLQFKSYAISKDLPKEDILNPGYDNELNRSRIIEAIHGQMINKGYLLEEENPGLLVDFHIIIKDRTAITTINHSSYRPWDRSEVEAFQYTEGTLVIHMVNTKTKQLIWQGTAVSLLNENTDKIEEKINKTVAMVFKKYPDN